MEYTIQQLAGLAGISTRTLRYYDQIGLLRPKRNPNSEYRIYTEHEVDVLQQILFYKELGFPLSAIKSILENPEFDRREALSQHLKCLEEKEQTIKLLIQTVKKTIKKEEGSIQMNDREKFIGFKKELLKENEEKYGEEVRESYGEDAVKASNEKFMNLSKEDYDYMQTLSLKLQEHLESAVAAHADPSGPEGKAIAHMHKEWLGYTWTSYTPEAHRGLADMYVADERFTAYYDKKVTGCARFLRDAIHAHIAG